jgi:GntR family transcriptional regulator/MocR family aminotransferase
MLDLSATPPGPLHLRLAAALRTAIKIGRIPYGAAVPPSRTLADDLRVSRWTVTRAYGQLISEGYLSGRTGSATRVSWTAPAVPEAPAPVSPAPARYDLSLGQPDLRAFPRRLWVNAMRAAAETTPFDQLNHSGSGGHPRLRAVIAEHLNRSRGGVVHPGMVGIYAGAGQSLLQVCRALRADGHTAIGVEDPGSERHWQAARAAGLDLVPVPVDQDGLVVAALPAGLRAVCVSPAHHPATGVVLASSRRDELIEWARAVDGLIVEDDYDAEFSYGRTVPAALQGRAPDRVALLGSMSRSLGPAVGIGWLAAPPRWTDRVRAAQEIELHPPALNQLALAQLMESGDYDRHLRAARRRFRARRAALLAALGRALPGLPVSGAEAGLHLLLDLPPGTDAAAVTAEARRRDLQLCYLDDMRLTPGPPRPALLLCYANLKDSLIDEAVDVLAATIHATRPVTAGRRTRG